MCHFRVRTLIYWVSLAIPSWWNLHVAESQLWACRKQCPKERWDNRRDAFCTLHVMLLMGDALGSRTTEKLTLFPKWLSWCVLIGMHRLTLMVLFTQLPIATRAPDSDSVEPWSSQWASRGGRISSWSSSACESVRNVTVRISGPFPDLLHQKLGGGVWSSCFDTLQVTLKHY